MEQLLVNLIAGAMGGNALAKAWPALDMDAVGNTLAGLVGGGILGQLVTLAWPAAQASIFSGELSIGSLLINIASGGAGGAILTAAAGAIKSKVS